MLDDKWIIDLSDTNMGREKRNEIFKKYIEDGSPVWFKDFKTKNEEYLSVFSWDDISFVNRNPGVFESEKGYMINDKFESMPFDGSLLSIDGDNHKRLRGIVSRFFTSSMVEKLEPKIREIVKKSFDKIINSSNSADIFNSACTDVPLDINVYMMGIPDEIKYDILHATKRVIGNDDPDYGNGNPLQWFMAAKKLRRYAKKTYQSGMGIESEYNITQALLKSLDDDNILTEEEYTQFFMLLCIAGMETTTHALAHGVKLLFQNPDQAEMLKKNFDKYIETIKKEKKVFRKQIKNIFT